MKKRQQGIHLEGDQGLGVESGVNGGEGNLVSLATGLAIGVALTILQGECSVSIVTTRSNQSK